MTTLYKVKPSLELKSDHIKRTVSFLAMNRDKIYETRVNVPSSKTGIC
jgi:hypothetical protein